MQEHEGDEHEATIRNIVARLNNIAQRLFCDFDQVKDIHSEAHRLWNAYNDGLTDCLALAMLDGIMIEISSFFLSFSNNHLQAVINLRKMELTLTRGGISDSDRDLALVEAITVAKKYENFEQSLAPLRKHFMESASYFQFPKAR